MNNNVIKQFLLLLLIFSAISIGVSFLTTDASVNFWTTRNIILSLVKALIFSLVFFFVVMPKSNKNE